MQELLNEEMARLKVAESTRRATMASLARAAVASPGRAVDGVVARFTRWRAARAQAAARRASVAAGRAAILSTSIRREAR